MFKGANILKFARQFDTKDNCLSYLSSLKCRKGFVCSRCKNESWSKTCFEHIRRCITCKHEEYATAGTLFHKCKIDLPKALMMVKGWLRGIHHGVKSLQP
jgi:hypothetical protein